ncbi:MAG: transporter, family, multidrug resistance protein [Actinomycetota bacterium]|jgi:DHA2 family multidrug resistance protein-like MFS transporter|nr:transporter, family, multidrug resistance protein [Actinomycetota bacterium]
MKTLSAPRAGRKEWIGLAVLALPCLLVTMDLDVLYLAVPSLSKDLLPSSSQLLWITDIYGFLIAGSLITMGSLGDRIGRRRLLLIGAAAFSAASVFAAFSTSAAMLIAARALLGIAGATLSPSTLSLIRNMFLDSRQRTFAVGVWASSFSAGGAIGPLVGGLLLEHFWWGAAFLAGVPIMVLLLVLGPLLLPEFRDPAAGLPDLLSAALSLVAVLAVIYGVKQIAEGNIDPASTLSIVAGIIGGVIFVRRQGELADPLIDPRLFRVPAFGASLATNLVALFAAYGAFLFIAQYLQLVLGLSPLRAGLWTVPSSGALILGSMLSPGLVRRIRPGFVIAGGLLLSAVGLGVLALVNTTSDLTTLVIASLILFFGIAPAFTLATDLIVGTAPAERAGAASAISETSAELGGALGIAILGSIGAAVYRRALAVAIPSSIPSRISGAARGTLGGALSLAGRLPHELGARLLAAARASFIRGLQVTSVVAAGATIAIAILTAVVLRDVRTASDGDAEDA